MEFLILIAVLSVIAAIGITAFVGVPVMRILLNSGVENPVTENKAIYYISLFLIAALFLPASLFILHNSDTIDVFNAKLAESLK